MVGRGVKKDVKAAPTHAPFAMINLIYYYEQVLGTEIDLKKAQLWIDKSFESGHWLGRIERGGAQCKGLYGIPIDKKTGEADFRQALAIQNREVLDILAHFYAEGEGVDTDRQRAADSPKRPSYKAGTQRLGLIFSLIWAEHRYARLMFYPVRPWP
jgi:TPR repeat protein